jgi:hypothetical protein
LKRLLSALGGILAGGVLAASGLFGASSSTEDEDLPVEPLRVAEYCREVYGDDANAYRPTDLGDWRCSVWTNGVWGLEDIDFNDACRWQRGEHARWEPLDGSERAVACTL